MVFTSHIFLFYFLPLVLGIYYLLPRGRNVFLLLASYVFYAWEQPWYVLLMITATLLNYACGQVIIASRDRPRRARAAVVVSVCGSLGLLAFFKYYVFVGQNVNSLLAACGGGTFTILPVALPIGISFYIFQSLSYSIDVYRGVAPPVRSLWDFACYVSLFPQLIAGPIVRYNTIADQLVERGHTVSRFASGASLFILGFAKKVLLANTVGQLADAAFGAEGLHAIDAWFGVAAYAFQIYFDFAGYSDMAVGLGRMVGFEFLRNFNAPYRSISITDFWRRWHISLSTFLRDYLYIPLGGNRRGPRRTLINLAIVMLLGGLWHGANWTFIVWGALHGAMLIFERLIGKRSLYAGLPQPLQIAITFAIVLVTWVFFRAESIGEAWAYLGAMFGIGEVNSTAGLMAGMLYTPGSLLHMVLCGFLVFAPWQAHDWVERLSGWRFVILLALFAVAIGSMVTQAFNPFLYFQF